MLILDTHAILWDAFEPNRLSRRARTAIEDADSRAELRWADISIWEIALLAERGRFPLPPPYASTIEDLLMRRSARVLPISAAVAVRAQGLYALRGDPADSLIAATALEHDAIVITADERIAAMPGVRVLW